MIEIPLARNNYRNIEKKILLVWNGYISLSKDNQILFVVKWIEGHWINYSTRIRMEE